MTKKYFKLFLIFIGLLQAEIPYCEYEIFQVPSHGYVAYYSIDSIDDLIKNQLRKGDPWESHIALFITQYTRPNSQVLDIGAHIGVHTMTMAHATGPQGKVFAFEPQPKIFQELVQNIQINKLENVSCYWAAVGSEKGQIELPSLDQYNEGGTSLVKPTLSSKNWSYQVQGGTDVFVDLLTIDSLDLDNVSLIKIDVEGMENAVLDGAKQTITRNKPVIILEIMGKWTPEYAPPEILQQIEFTKKKVEEMGYTLHRFFYWDYLALPTKAF